MSISLSLSLCVCLSSLSLSLSLSRVQTDRQDRHQDVEKLDFENRIL
jgi:hypothetical protein